MVFLTSLAVGHETRRISARVSRTNCDVRMLLAAVSLPRIRLAYAPDVAFPEVAVTLRLPPSANLDSSETTRRWVVPIESAIRSVGDVTGTRGDINADSATVVARFKRGTDAPLKAARLASELAPLRARLSAGGALAIWPAEAGTGPSAVFAITGAAASDAAATIADQLRSTPGVRDVRTYGGTEQEVDVRLMNDSPSAATGDVIIHDIAPRSVGDMRIGSRRAPVFVAPAARVIRDIRVGSTLLGAIAEIREHRAAPTTVARLNGRPAAIVAVFRDDDVPLFRVDDDVNRIIGDRGVSVWSDAGELRLLFRRLALGALMASILLAIGGGLPLGFYIPIAVAVIINVWRIASLRADVQTLLVASIAVAAIAPVAAGRTVSRDVWPLLLAMFFVVLLPIAVVFGSGALAPILSTPARDFAITAVCALIAAYLCGAPRPSAVLAAGGGGPTQSSGGGPTQSSGGGAPQKILRNAASVVLACLTITMFLLSWFGNRLDPRRSEGSADRSRVYVRLTLPSGTTLDQTTTVAARIERGIQTLDGVKRFWTYAGAGYATIVIEVEPRVQQPQRMELFRIALRSRIPTASGTIIIDDRFDRASGSSLAESIEEQPRADENGGEYRFLLKGTDAQTLRRTADELSTRLARMDVSRRDIVPEWPEASPRIELVPKVHVPPPVADTAAALLVERTLPPVERHLPDGRLLRVASTDSPLSPDDAPRRADVFARPLTIGGRLVALDSAFVVRSSSTNGAMTRELGRFVLPIAVRVRGASREQALAKRSAIDRTIGLAAFPAGVVAERPSLVSWKFSAAKLRLVTLAAFLPVLLLTAAAMALGSLSSALLALTPAAMALAVIAPALTAASARLDETTLLAAGAALCCVVAAATVTLLRFTGHTTGRVYRVLHDHVRVALISAFAGALMLGVAASARPAIGDLWRAPLLASSAVILAGMPAAVLLPASIDVLLRYFRRRRGSVARAIAHPAVWADETVQPHLSVRNLTKVYGSGFRALHRVSFDLSAGVIGLLGPNGAGKTTLLRILTGLLQPTRGTVAYQDVPIRDENISDFRRAIGFLPQEFNAYAGLTAEQFLDFWALERGMNDPAERRQQIEELLVVVGLEEHAGRRVREFSGGMRQRIGIARALLANPPLLVVDEPTTGLDIDARRRFRDLLMALARNRVVILSSHIASDVETTALRILLLVRGRLQWDGSVDGLIARARGRVFETVVSDEEVHAMAHRYRITTRVRLATGVRVRGVVSDSEPLPGAEVEPSLEEAYLSEVSTGGPIRRGSFAFLFERRSSSKTM